jgi:hypothetical protein
VGVRALEGQIDRATLRTTLTYQLHPRLSLGVEWNPLSGDVSPLANLLAWPESDHAPAIVLGTSSDRIGTPHGQAFYATASKNLTRETGLPIAPYAGVAYGTWDDRVRPIGGLNIGFSEALSSLVIFDGEHAHPTLTYVWGRHAFTFLLVEGVHPGFSYSVAFGLPATIPGRAE